MRINYLALDRPDIQYAGKELARGMSNPTVADVNRLKRLGRYLVGAQRVVLKYDFQKFTNQLRSCVDSDHAGCLKTRKSTNGGALMLGSHCIKSWS